MPAILRAVNRPAERRRFEVVVGIFKRRVVLKNEAHCGDIAMPCCPMKRGRVVPTTRIDRQSGVEHQLSSLQIALICRMGELSFFGGAELKDLVSSAKGLDELILTEPA